MIVVHLVCESAQSVCRTVAVCAMTFRLAGCAAVLYYCGRPDRCPKAAPTGNLHSGTVLFCCFSRLQHVLLEGGELCAVCDTREILRVIGTFNQSRSRDVGSAGALS